MKQAALFAAYANWIIALAAGALTSTTFIRYHADINYHITGFITVATLLLYSFQRILKFLYITQHPEHYEWCKKNFRWLVLQCVIALAGLIFFIPRLPLIVIYALLTAGVFSLLYFFVSPASLRATGLRQLPYLKSILIAMVWGIVTCLVPLLSLPAETIPKPEILATFIEHVLFIYILMIPFDIRDINLDSVTMKTLPQWAGIHYARMAGLLLLPVFILILEWTPLARPLPVLITFFTASVVVYVSHEKKPAVYYTYVIDGMIFLYAVMWLVFRYLEIA